MNGLQIDINTGDLLVERSAAVVADASGFIAELVLRSCRGEFKEHPLLGAEAPLRGTRPVLARQYQKDAPRLRPRCL